LYDPIPMVALNLDSPFLDGPASAKPCFQLGCKLGNATFVQRQIGDDSHTLATPALRLPAHSDDGGLVRGRWLVRFARTSLLELVALGAKQLPPIVLSHASILFN